MYFFLVFLLCCLLYICNKTKVKTIGIKWNHNIVHYEVYCVSDVLYEVVLSLLVTAGVIENYTSSKRCTKREKCDLCLKYWWGCAYIFYEIQEEVYFLCTYCFFRCSLFVLSLIEAREEVTPLQKRTTQHRTRVTTWSSFGCPACVHLSYLFRKLPYFQHYQENCKKKKSWTWMRKYLNLT